MGIKMEGGTQVAPDAQVEITEKKFRELIQKLPEKYHGTDNDIHNQFEEFQVWNEKRLESTKTIFLKRFCAALILIGVEYYELEQHKKSDDPNKLAVAEGISWNRVLLNTGLHIIIYAMQTLRHHFHTHQNDC